MFTLRPALSLIAAVYLASASTSFGADLPKARWVPGEQYYDAVMNMLDHVQGSESEIDVLQFNFFTESGQVRAIGQKLKQIKSKWPSLPVRVFLEGEKDAEKPTGAAPRNKLTQKFFEGSGIEVHFVVGLREGKIQGVSHAKAFRVGNQLLSGSTNLTNTSVGKNNEFNLLVESEPIATKFGEFLEKLRADSSKLYELQATDGTVRFMTDTLYFDAALALINEAQAKDALDVTTYFFAYRSEKDTQARQIFDALVAAHERGVNVRVFLERNDNPAVNQDITKANLGVAERFAQKGLTAVYLDPAEKISHFKIIRLSGPKKKAALIGSTNLYRGDFSENHQVNFRVEDSALVDELGAYLNQKFAYEGTRHVSQAPMLRFWRGFKQPGVQPATVLSKLNESLIPETTNVGAQRGLLAYLPALYSPEDKPEILPDEIALIAYQNEDAYNAIRTTPRGAAYGPLHFQPGLFAQQLADGRKSTSAVAQAYAGEAKSGVAYLLNENSIDWQQGQVVFRTLMKNGASDPKAYIDQMKQSQERIGYTAGVILVDYAYVLELLQFESASAARRGMKELEALKPGSYSLFKAMQYESQATGATRLGFGTGVNVQFKADLLPVEDLLAPVLKPLKSD